MAYINVPEGVPGIRSLVLFRPETGKPLYDLAQVLLRGESPLSEAARELYGNEQNTVDAVLKNVDTAEVSPKLKALLHIAGKVQVLGKEVTTADIDAARSAGATDRELHDTVLIAAAFSMFNRYVDGLASFTPEDPEAYDKMGKRMAANGYAVPQQPTGV
jgi:alkylhydroperoxidase/carboxymuconolactone decarboxylase family protein YurZ